MAYFGQFFLDKEKDIVVRLEMEGKALSYTIFANHHRSDNLINNFAAISGEPTTLLNGRTVITGDIPCYIKGDGQRVYILRLNGLKLANIYPDGKIQVNSLIPYNMSCFELGLAQGSNTRQPQSGAGGGGPHCMG